MVGYDATEIHGKLNTAYGEGHVSYSTVARWVHRFSSGRELVEDDPRNGRPITDITQENIDAVKDLVSDDLYTSIDMLAVMLDVSHGSVSTILKQHLLLRKVSARWVPPELTAGQRQRLMDICAEYLKRFESGAWRLCDIMTDAETWIYHRRIESKQQSIDFSRRKTSNHRSTSEIRQEVNVRHLFHDNWTVTYSSITFRKKHQCYLVSRRKLKTIGQ